ncbi:MAG TPA: hypothetical protein VER33_08250 [Polyangiaceae bacterium]|nr:hypothetical protein [Polyangiaceae bacterium]
MTRSMALGARITALRLAERRSWIWFVVAVLVCTLGASFMREQGSPSAADMALVHITFGLVVPLLAYLSFDAALAGQAFEQAVNPLARHGGSGREAAVGASFCVCVLLVGYGAALGALTVLVSRGGGDARVLADAWASSWIGAVAGLAYGAWYTLASTLGKRGGGRIGLLLTDWVLGASTGFLAVPFPRAHIRSLLGGTPALDWSQTAGLVALVLGSALAGSLGAARLRR